MHVVLVFLLIVSGIGLSEQSVLQAGVTDGRPSWCEKSAFGASAEDKETCGW